ncbi:MAG: ABC transporter ATP-binding protein [Aquiluna sp.]|nr:ABC transporter ATP-binding protein [Aquiluna sp.]
MTLLSLSNITKSFGEGQVLSGISLEVDEGELLAVLGSSGAGKSTLLRLIAGFEKLDSGEIVFDQRVVAGSEFVPPEKRHIGIVPQDGALFPHLNVYDNIGFGLPKDQKRDGRIQQLLELIELTGYEKRKPQELSGGQMQRVALARALAPRPKLVLLDEPFSALDAELRERLRSDVRRIIRAEGVSAILVTHDQEEALSLADQVAVLRQGRIIQVGTPTEIYNEPADVGIATFLGDSVLIDGQVQDGKLITDLGRLTPLNHVEEGQVGVVAIRSENFYLQPNPAGDSEVVGRVFFGHDAVVEVQTPTLRIKARSNGPFAPEVGMKVTLWVRGAVNFYPST